MVFDEKLKGVVERKLKGCKHMEVFDVSVLAQQENKKYSVFLLPQTGRNIWDIDKVIQICSDVEEFLYAESESNAMLLLKLKTGEKEGFWVPIFTRTFSLCLNEKLAKERFEDTPKIYFEGDVKATIQKDFQFSDYFSTFIVEIGARFYLIRQNNTNIYNGGSDVSIKEFPLVEPLKMKNEFKVVESQQYFYSISGKITFGPAFSIEEIEDYKSKRKSVGYVAKDERGNTIGIYIVDISWGNFSYQINLPKPAKRIKFIKQIEQKASTETFCEIWGINYGNDEVAILMQVCCETGKGSQTIIPI